MNMRAHDSGYSDTTGTEISPQILEYRGNVRITDSNDSLQTTGGHQSMKFQHAKDSLVVMRERDIKSAAGPVDHLNWSPSPVRPIPHVKRMIAKWESTTIKDAINQPTKMEDDSTATLDVKIDRATKVHFEEDSKILKKTVSPGKVYDSVSPWLSLVEESSDEEVWEDARE